MDELDARSAVDVLAAWPALGAVPDDRLDRSVDTAWAVIAARIGEESLVARVRDEARRPGAPSDGNRRRLADALNAAALRDPGFARDLRELVRELTVAASRTGGAPVSVRGGNHVGTVHAGGSVRIKQSVITYARGHPVLFVAVLLALLGVLGAGGYGLTRVIAGSDAGGGADVAVDRSSPESTAAAFAAALTRHDRQAAERLTCAEEHDGELAKKLRNVNGGTIREGGQVFMGVTVSVALLRVDQSTDPNGGTRSARFAWVHSGVPDDAPAVIKEAASERDDWSMSVRRGQDGLWLMC